jgi:hypothetical protein
MVQSDSIEWPEWAGIWSEPTGFEWTSVIIANGPP